MAKLGRVYQKQFGVNAGASDVGIFGSLAASNPQYSKDPETIQSLNAFLTGWAAETIANNRPALEDFNALDFLVFYQLCYLFQAGIPEYDADTTYYEGSICQVAGVLYRSLDDDNINNDPTTEADKWELVVNDFVPTAVNALAGSVVQVQFYSRVDLVACSALLPNDDTKPQIGEGTEVLTKAFTPKLSDSKILAIVNLSGASTGTGPLIASVYNEASNPIASGYGGNYETNDEVLLSLQAWMDSWGTTAKAVTVRVGAVGTQTFYLNGSAGSPDSRKFGGAVISGLTLIEYKA